jgi:single-stranded DNA-binding protein
MSLNTVILSGALAREPQLSYGTRPPRTRLDVVCHYPARDDGGKWVRQHTIVPVVVDGDKAERTAGWLKEGMVVEVEGSIRAAKVETADGFGTTCYVLARRVDQVKGVTR